MEPIQIIEKHKDFIVINKPSGVSTHASPGDTADNVVDLLKNEYERLFPVMRLDNGTSGLLVLGLTEDFAAQCTFLEKKYQAIVFGAPPKNGKIDLPLTKKQFITRKKVTQEAETIFKLLKAAKTTALLELTISTGRHHQIRKHLRSIECPIVGDFRHGYKDKNLALQETLGERLRLALHCTKLSFKYKDFTHKYESSLPDSLNSYLV